MLKYGSQHNLGHMRRKNSTVLQETPTGCNEVRYKNATKMKNPPQNNSFAILVIWPDTFSNHSSAWMET